MNFSIRKDGTSLVDPASSHMLATKLCMSKSKLCVRKYMRRNSGRLIKSVVVQLG